ncbi:MAG: hypothetical protein ABI847_08200, partial [Anaerolineales bacterium]
KVGADGYAATASATVVLAKSLMQSMGYDISGGQNVPAETVAAVAALENMMQTLDRVEMAQAAAAAAEPAAAAVEPAAPQPGD